MDNLSLTAALEIYGVESITHTRLHTDHALENLSGLGHEQGASDGGGGLHAESNMTALVLFFFLVSLIAVVRNMK